LGKIESLCEEHSQQVSDLNERLEQAQFEVTVRKDNALKLENKNNEILDQIESLRQEHADAALR
jgi:hypothetical protein